MFFEHPPRSFYIRFARLPVYGLERVLEGVADLS